MFRLVLCEGHDVWGVGSDVLEEWVFGARVQFCCELSTDVCVDNVQFLGSGTLGGVGVGTLGRCG